MARLLVHVEGVTEESFVRDVLAQHLVDFGYTLVSPRLVGNARLRGRRGGIRGWNGVRDEIARHLKEDVGCAATTMVDYYGMPQVGSGAWPGRAAASHAPHCRKAVTVEEAMMASVCDAMGPGFDARRFIPYVVMHEFEGLLFSDCQRFSDAIGRPDLATQLQAIRDDFGSPEEINDAPATAPSRRLLQLVPNYEKPLMGTLGILGIGLDGIARECPHFREWLNRMQDWGRC